MDTTSAAKHPKPSIRDINAISKHQSETASKAPDKTPSNRDEPMHKAQWPERDSNPRLREVRVSRLAN